MTSPGPIIALSNRGPFSWTRNAAGNLTARRGAGGLVSALGPALASTGGLWIASALSADDRAAAELSPDTSEDAGLRVQLLDIPDAVLHAALDVFANQYLWYAYHDLWNRSRSPSFDHAAHQAWDAYVQFNTYFADAAEAACSEGATVLVQDYHLNLVPALLADRGIGARVGHFTHTPFATRSALAVLPDAWAVEVVRGMAAADVVGFHTHRWAQRFEHAARATLGPDAEPRVDVFPLGPDPKTLAAESVGEDVAADRRELESRIGARRAIVRVDRAEPAKNVLRGLAAFDELLERRPELTDEVVHVVLLNPSRQALPEYRRYLEDAVSAADDICSRRGHDCVMLYAEDRYPRSLAALALADVLIANPISDGMNLVAKEGPLVNENAAPLILSTEAGAYEQLAEVCISLNPYDVSATATAFETALAIDEAKRRATAAALRKLCAGNPPDTWIDAQLKALTG